MGEEELDDLLDGDDEVEEFGDLEDDELDAEAPDTWDDEEE